jgi:cell division protein FtsA
MLPAGVVLTGGGAKLSKIKDLAKDVLELNCIIGTPKNIAGLPDDPALATVAGLALGGVDIAEDPGNIRGAGIFQPVWRFLKKAFKMFVP